MEPKKYDLLQPSYLPYCMCFLIFISFFFFFISTPFLSTQNITTTLPFHTKEDFCDA